MNTNVIRLVEPVGGHDRGKTSRAPTTIDKTIGRALRAKRLSQGRSMDDVSAAIDISYQMLQKIEMGVNRLTVSRLIEIAGYTGMDAGAFVADLAHVATNAIDESRIETMELLAIPGARELLECYDKIPVKGRKALLALVQQLSGGKT